MKLSNIYKSLRKDWREMKRKAIIELLKEHNMLSSRELSEKIGLSQPAIISTIREMIDVTRVNTTAGPKYMLTKKYEELRDKVLNAIKDEKRISVRALSDKVKLDYKLLMDILNDLEILNSVKIIYDNDTFVEVVNCGVVER